MKRQTRQHVPTAADEGRSREPGWSPEPWAETDLLRAQREQKLQTIGLLTAGIAHDFNNLLTAVLGHASLLAESIPTTHPDRRSLDEIMAGAQQAVALAAQLLAFTRPSANESRPLNLNAVARDTHSLLKRVIGAHVQLQLDLDPALRLVRGDAAQLTQVLMNLVINARDALKEGTGRICIRTCNRVEQGESDERSYVVLEVEDNGRGMDDVTQRRLFEPFFSRRSGGTGLGMSIVDAIVSAHEGRVLVHSEVGRGTTISVVLNSLGQLP